MALLHRMQGGGPWSGAHESQGRVYYYIGSVRASRTHKDPRLPVGMGSATKGAGGKSQAERARGLEIADRASLKRGWRDLQN
jgi:hypothetical protein